MLTLFRPLAIAVLVTLLVVFVNIVARQLVPLPLGIQILLGVITFFLSGLLSAAGQMSLKSYSRALYAWFTNAPFVYEIDIRIFTKTVPDVGTLKELLERNYATRAVLGVRGSNYLQARFNEPPKTVEITIQPDPKGAMEDEGADWQSNEVSEDEVDAYVIHLGLVDPIELRFRDSEGKPVRETFNILKELAADVSQAFNGSKPYFSVTVNRFRKGARPKHPYGPGPSGEIKDTSDVKIRRDRKALQLQSNSSASIVKHLKANLADLEPV